MLFEKVKAAKWKVDVWMKKPRPIIAGQRDWSWAEELPAHPATISITHAKALEVEVVKIRSSAGSSHVPRRRSFGGCRCCR